MREVEVAQVDLTDEEKVKELVVADEKIFGPDDAFTPEVWRGYEAFKILVNGKLAGCAAMGRNLETGKTMDEDLVSPGSAFLASIGIFKEFGSQGVGFVVMESLINWAKIEGFCRLISNFRPSNIPSQRLHVKMGFREIRREQNFYRNPVEDAIVVELVL